MDSSMLMRTPAPAKARDVNWLPWSLLKISGVPRASARSRVLMQNELSSVTETSHAMAYLLNQSMIATSRPSRGASGRR